MWQLRIHDDHPQMRMRLVPSNPRLLFFPCFVFLENMAGVGMDWCLYRRHPLDSLRLQVRHVHLEGEVRML